MKMAAGLEEAAVNGTLPASTEKLLGALDENKEDESEDLDDEQMIVEEYKLWRKNCRYMYSFVSETALTWPSLSVQFVRGNTFENKMKDTKFGVTRNLLLTTHSSGEDDDFLKIASLQLPKLLTENKEMSPEELESVNSRLKISKKFKQDVEINKVRVNPFDSSVFATLNAKGEVYVYELDSKMNVSKETKLLHHGMNGFGLAWNPNDKFQLVTGSEDQTVAVWDYSKSEKPLHVFHDHADFVNDVRFAFKRKNVIGSIGEDGYFVLRDLDAGRTVLKERLLDGKVSLNSFTFSPHSEHLVLFGGEDSNSYIYDLRNMARPLHVLVGHTKSITNVEWDPFHHNIVASSSTDRRVILWDLTKIGEEQLPEESEDGVPELVMMHGGHTGGVNDFTFNPEIEWCLASCSDDNIVHVWGVKPSLVDARCINAEEALISDSMLE